MSIITVSYNAERFISESLKSVCCQGVDVEHLIIDGASSDNTLEIVGKYPHVAHVVSEPDRGVYDAMNKGLALATGDVVGILNADDYYADDSVLKRVCSLFENPNIDACYGDLVYIQDGRESILRDNNKNISDPKKIVRYWESGPFSRRKFYWGWMPPHPTFFVRREIYEEFGKFDLSFGTASDYELMLRFLLKYGIRCEYIPEILVDMRVGGVSNVSFKNRLNAHMMDREAWRVNGLKPYPWTLSLKPLRKIPQWWRRPS